MDEYIPDRPIAFNRDFVNLGIGITGALFLSQAICWSKKTKNESEWFYKTAKEWEEKTGMTRKEQETARKKLKALHIIEEKRKGVPAKLYYKVNYTQLSELLTNKNAQQSLRKITIGIDEEISENDIIDKVKEEQYTINDKDHE